MDASAGSLHSVDAFNSSLSPPPELTVVYRLESRDGAIFDMDDRVCDVADDKETVRDKQQTSSTSPKYSVRFFCEAFAGIEHRKELSRNALASKVLQNIV